MTVCRLARAMLSSVLSSASSSACTLMIASFTNMCASSATWSLRLRPVCRRPPAAPMRSVSSFSTFMCMSSASISNVTLPASMSASMPFRPSTIRSASDLGIMPCSPSIVACAIEPSMSCLYRRLSNDIDEWKSSTMPSVAFSKRPPHSFIAIRSFARRSAPVCKFMRQTGRAPHIQ